MAFNNEYVPPEVAEYVKIAKLAHIEEGHTIKLRHLYESNGEPCSLNKSRALALTRSADGWVWYCHRCGTKGGLKKLFMSTQDALEYVKNRSVTKVKYSTDTFSLPPDVVRITQNDYHYSVRNIPWNAITWLRKYDIIPELLDRYFICWSPSLNRVIIPIHSSIYTVPNFKQTELIGWCGRDVDERSKEDRALLNIPKYLIKRKTSNRLIFASKGPLPSEEAPAVMVEDVLSAIRVSSAANCHAFAMLNTDVPRDLLDRLGHNRRIILWLDNNMTVKMIQMAANFRQLGYKVSYISTQKDPKCYNNQGIATTIRASMKSEGCGIHTN